MRDKKNKMSKPIIPLFHHSNSPAFFSVFSVPSVVKEIVFE